MRNQMSNKSVSLLYYLKIYGFGRVFSILAPCQKIYLPDFTTHAEIKSINHFENDKMGEEFS